MKAKPLIITGIALAAGTGLFLYYRKQYNLLMDYTIAPSGLRFTHVSADLVQMQISLRFTNKSNLQCRIERIYGEVYIKGQHVGFFNEIHPFVIPAKGESDVPVEISFSPKKVVQNVVGFLAEMATKKDIAIDVKGYVTVKSGILTLNVPYTKNGTLKEYMTD